MTISAKPEVIARYYEYLLWLMQRIAKFPRNQRYTLGKHLEEKGLQILATLIQAYYQKDKTKLLQAINLDLELIRYLIRLAKDLQLFSMSQYSFSTSALVEIGRQVGGWLKQQKRYEANR